VAIEKAPFKVDSFCYFNCLLFGEHINLFLFFYFEETTSFTRLLQEKAQFPLRCQRQTRPASLTIMAGKLACVSSEESE
ncbi:hypothetical protein, partial [Exiguobacterium artemiae]